MPKALQASQISYLADDITPELNPILERWPNRHNFEPQLRQALKVPHRQARDTRTVVQDLRTTQLPIAPRPQAQSKRLQQLRPSRILVTRRHKDLGGLRINPRHHGRQAAKLKFTSDQA